MRDQLSLRLEPDVPSSRTSLRRSGPMLPRPLAEPFDSDAHLFEPSWGGLRALAFVGLAEVAGGGDVMFVDGVGRELANLPELAGLAVRVDARSAVLDGELVVVDANGLADADELGRRLAGERGRPVAYLAFDLLHLDGRSLLSAPLTRRRETLRRVLRPGDEVVAVPAIAGEGRAPRGGRGPGNRRDHGPPADQPVPARDPEPPWRFVPTPAGGAVAAPAETELEPEGPVAASAPVVALIRRLPLLFED